MKLTQLVLGACALLLLPLQVSAEIINVYPGPDAEWNYQYDYGEVELGLSESMVFQIENDPEAVSDLWIYILELENDTSGSFSITSFPNIAEPLGPGESRYVEVSFTPAATGDHSASLRLFTNASNDPPGPDIDYYLQGSGVEYTQSPEELINALINTVISLNLRNGISNALDSKLDNVLRALEDANENNDMSAINVLYAFIYSVEAQRGKELSDAEADSLIAAAQAIIDLLSE